MPIISFGQEDVDIDIDSDMKQNLKEFIDNIVKTNNVLQKAKLKIILNDKEIVNPSDYEIHLDDLKMKVEKKEKNIDGVKEEEIEIRITEKKFNVS